MQVPCHPEHLPRRDKPTGIRFTILKPLSAGFGAAPYKRSVKQDPDAKKLSEMTTLNDDAGRTIPAMLMWSFRKVGGIGDKGTRTDDTKWTISAGATITLWLDEARFGERAKAPTSRFVDPIVPDNMAKIPAFTVCEVTLTSKNVDRAMEGSGVKIVSVKPSTFSLYSLTKDLPLLSQNLAHARLIQTKSRDSMKPLEKDLETKDIPYFAPVHQGAVVDDQDVEATNTVRLMNWGDGSTPQIDLPLESLLKYTNTTRADWATALLDVAIASNALSVLVFSSEYWHKGLETGFRAVPIIDVETLLAAVTPSAIQSAAREPQGLIFPTHVDIDKDGVAHQLQIAVDPKSHPVETGAPPPLHDFALTGLSAELQAAHAIAFNLVSQVDGEVTPSIWKGFFNAAPTTVLAPLQAGCKHRRLQSMDD